MDIMKINGIPFLTTISRIVSFASATPMTSTNMEHVMLALRIVVGKYFSRGFVVMAVGADNGFAALAENEEFLTLGITLNLTAEDEHEPYIEQFNRRIKERCRMIFAGIPFLSLPKIMVIELVRSQVYWFDFTIPENYISQTLGPAAIVLGRTYDYNKIYGQGSKFGEYVQTHE